MPTIQPVLVRTFRHPPEGAFERGHIEPFGGISRTALARSSTPPGIAANAEMYVAAWWGGFPGFNHLWIAASENGRSWSDGASFFIANPQHIDARSRPSVTYFPPRRSWFVAYRHADTGGIHIVEFDIRCRLLPGGGPCEIDGAGATVFAYTQLTNPLEVGLSRHAPALSHLGDRLVLAFTAAASSNVVVTTSGDGTAFTPAVAATAGGAPINSASGAPFLHNSLGTLFLAVTDNPPTSTTDIAILSSTDGVTFVGVRRIPRVGNPLVGGDIDAAVTGPPSELIVAHRTHLQSTTTVWLDGGSTTLPTDTHLGVGLAFGPGPTQTARVACSDPVLVARGSSRDVTIPAGMSGSVDANGDITLVCGALAPLRPGCPGNTRQVLVTRGSTGNAFVECWPR
jgi:hypothetical protein